MLELAFLNKDIREICEDGNKAIAQYGMKITLSLHSRLSDLRAAKSIKDLIAGNPGELSENLYKVDLFDNHQLIFCANHVKLPLKENGNLDWENVTRIKILEIKKTHG